MSYELEGGDEGYKDYKCESCGKPFSQAGSLKIHNHSVHKYNRCNSSGGELFINPKRLKKNIRALHDDQKASRYNDSQILNDNNPEISTTIKSNNFGLTPDDVTTHNQI